MSSPKFSPQDFLDASETGEMYLAFQPKLNLGTGRVDGAEALARWQHPRDGALDPARFVRSAELCGVIDWFTEWVITEAVEQWAHWHREGLDLQMAVNISALNLERDEFPELVERLCAMGRMPRERLILELTERPTETGPGLVDTAARQRLKGIALSFDDFRAGYASMLQVRQLPFTELKIDRSFIADLLTSRDSRTIARSFILLAHELGLSVTAEGVENEQTLEAITALGCDRAQGYFIAAPMTGDQLTNWLAVRGEHERAAGEAWPVARSA